MLIFAMRQRIPLLPLTTANSNGPKNSTAPEPANSASNMTTGIGLGLAPDARRSLQAALAAGMVNPVDWLTQFDVALVQKTTGALIKDGNISANGETRATSDLVNALFDLRTNGAPDGNRTVFVSGAITASDLEKYIQHYANAPAEVEKLDTDVLNKAIEQLALKSSPPKVY